MFYHILSLINLYRWCYFVDIIQCFSIGVPNSWDFSWQLECLQLTMTNFIFFPKIFNILCRNGNWLQIFILQHHMYSIRGFLKKNGYFFVIFKSTWKKILAIIFSESAYFELKGLFKLSRFREKLVLHLLGRFHITACLASLWRQSPKWNSRVWKRLIIRKFACPLL